MPVMSPITPLVPAAQYLRMSTDQQKLSLAYQAAAIQRYADTHGFQIIRTYEDPGRSGLVPTATVEVALFAPLMTVMLLPAVLAT